MTNEMKNTSANSICIPRAFANISEPRVRKVFDALNIFVIDRIDMIQRKNEKGEPFQRIFVHIKTWSETADARKAKDRLLAGKELKIVYDDPWFWKVSLNTWTPKPAPVAPSLHDRKPRIRIDFDEDTKNVDAAAALLNSLDLGKEDRRPYRERRSDPVYCEQDRNQGFNDRSDRRPSRFTDRSPARDDRRRSPVRDDRRPRDDRRSKNDERLMTESTSTSNRYHPRSPSSSPPPRRQEPKVKGEIKVKREITSAKPKVDVIVIAPALPVEVKVPPPLVRDNELVARMQHAFRCEITDKIYMDNRQAVREQLKENYEDSDPINYKNKDGVISVAPKRKQRTIIVEEVLDEVKG